MIERILLVLDGSQAAESAIPYAQGLTAAFSAKLTVFCARPDSASDSCSYIERVAQDISSSTGLSPVTAEAVGDLTQGIVSYAEEHKIELIIMSTHTRRGILLWPFGNIATKVLERTTIPVLSVKTVAPPASRILERIVVPLDGSKAGEATLPYAAALAENLKSELILLRVVEPGTTMQTFTAPVYAHLPPDEVQKLMTEARSYLCDVSRSLSGIKRLRLKAIEGRPPGDIVKYAEEVGADLIALSTHGKTAPVGIFGSVFRKVLQSGKTHILAIRPCA